MKIFEPENIRNIALVGHGGAGKTSLLSAALYSAGAVNRLGRVDEGTTVTDYEEEEIARKITLKAALAFCEWNKTKINWIDTPGYRAFIHEVKAVMPAVEGVIVVIDAVSGVEVQTELVWEYAQDFELPRMIVINRIDRDRASFERAMQSIESTWGRAPVPVQLPLGEEKDFRGIIDLLTNKAYGYSLDGSGKFTEEPIPAEKEKMARSSREKLVEMVAESSDLLMEKFFETGTLDGEDMIAGLKQAVMDSTVIPVFITSATSNAGVKQLLDHVVELIPSPLERKPVEAKDPKTQQAMAVKVDPNGPAAAFVFKTIADPFAGRVSLFKVFSGSLKTDSAIYNVNKESTERLAALQATQGKSHENMPEVKAGDIGAVAKLKDTTTGDSLTDRAYPVLFKKVSFPEPAISFAIEPKSRGDEDKISSAVAKILEEDGSLRFLRDPQTNEFLLSGSGQLHVEVAVERLKKKYGVSVTLKPPKVPYRETITAFAEAQGRHKKQTGGHGQYGDCWIKIESLGRGEGFVFEDKIFGGAIPKNYIPAVEKGIQEAAQRGYLAGYPVVDFKVTLTDGSYHEVDSSELAFKIAGSLAFKKAMEQAKPVLLEPVMNAEIYCPEESAGDLMGDLNGRRGRILGMDSKGHMQIIRAQVPFAEMLTYAPDLTSMTGGRGSFHMEFSHYDQVPAHIAAKIIEEKRKSAQEGAA
ncbi:MAG: elongation factor G [Acidobacteria bacterium]|nr:elongation factor G [Acidobacteriota bacterium]